MGFRPRKSTLGEGTAEIGEKVEDTVMKVGRLVGKAFGANIHTLSACKDVQIWPW